MKQALLSLTVPDVLAVLGTVVYAGTLNWSWWPVIVLPAYAAMMFTLGGASMAQFLQQPETTHENQS